MEARLTPSTNHRARPTRVLCVDDSSDITAVMRMMIETDPTMLCVGCLGSADRLLETVRKQSPPPDVVLLDATMPGKDPLAVMQEMATEFPAVRAIIYTGHEGQALKAKAKAAGAWGWVSKADEPEAILQAIRDVAAGRAWWAGRA